MATYTYEYLELGEEHSLGCKCCRFSKGVDLPIPKKLSREEIENLAPKFAHSIFSDWTKLNAILKRYEATIQKRWLKKTLKQRRDILLKAWPDMPSTHRPDFMGFRKVLKNAPRSRTQPSSSFLWPYINLEDLQHGHRLLVFLNSRGRNLPEKFVAADAREAHLGKGWLSSPDEDALTYMEFLGQHTPRTFGRLARGGNSFAAKQPILMRVTLGMVALEIQQGIYAFLVACAKLVLHDIDPVEYILAQHQPTPKLPETSSNDWPSLSAHTRDRPYRAPQSLDLNRIRLLAGSRRASAEDHLWLLREDPGYFVDSLKEWREHDDDMLKNACTACWRRVSERMIADAFTLFIFWDWIYRRLDKMPSLECQIRRADHKALRMAKQDEQTWVELLSVTQILTEFPIHLLSAGFTSSPRMRHCYTQTQLSSRKEDTWDYKKLTEAERRVDLLFHAIIYDEQRELHGLDHLVQETQYMLETDAQASQLVDPWIISIFSDLAMLSELEIRIQGIDPWSASFGASEVVRSPAVKKSIDKLMDLDIKLRSGFEDAFLFGDAVGDILRDPLKGAFDYPATKRQTETNVIQMRAAEKRLDAFWAAIETAVKSKTSLSPMKVIKNRLLEPRELHRTEEWMPPLVAPTVLKELNPNVSSFGLTTPIENEDTSFHAQVKIKTKTRGVSGTPKNNNETTLPPPNPDNVNSEPLRTGISVPKRAFKVFSALFPSSGSENHQRTEISWEELLQAMNTIGFQPEKLYGSVWIFMPKANGECKTDAKRSIQFHEPKEVRRGSKIPSNMVRTFGRRLRHAYGWESGMFVCE